MPLTWRQRRTAAREGLKAQVLRNEQLKLRLARLLRERFGASSEKLRGAIEQLELILGDLEEQIAETAPAELPVTSAADVTNGRNDPPQAGAPAAAGELAARRSWSTPRPVPARSAAARCVHSGTT